jgi:hypothetical protein
MAAIYTAHVGVIFLRIIKNNTNTSKIFARHGDWRYAAPSLSRVRTVRPDVNSPILMGWRGRARKQFATIQTTREEELVAAE